MKAPPERLPSRISVLRRRLEDSDITFRASRSAGPGGQNVNKLNTCVTLLFDLAGTRKLTEAEKQRIRDALPGRINSEGILRVVSRKHRTQRANRRAAVERLYELIVLALYQPAFRKPTQVPRGARQRRLQDKKAQGVRKKLRASPSDRDYI